MGETHRDNLASYRKPDRGTSGRHYDRIDSQCSSITVRVSSHTMEYTGSTAWMLATTREEAMSALGSQEINI